MSRRSSLVQFVASLTQQPLPGTPTLHRPSLPPPPPPVIKADLRPFSPLELNRINSVIKRSPQVLLSFVFKNAALRSYQTDGRTDRQIYSGYKIDAVTDSFLLYLFCECLPLVFVPLKQYSSINRFNQSVPYVYRHMMMKMMTMVSSPSSPMTSSTP